MSALPGEIAARRAALDAAALLETQRAADAAVTHSPLGSLPWIYLGLDAVASMRERQRERILPWIRSRACPVIGAGDSVGNPFAEACDVLVADDAEAQALIDNVERTPLAAMTLVQVLRATELLPIAPALLVESLGFATLQAGPEFRTWLAGRRDRARPLASGESPMAPPLGRAPPLRVERAVTTLSITLARPDRRNALSVAMRDALVEALELVARDPGIETAVIRGDGPDFCAGGDLAEFGTTPDPVTAHAVRSVRLPAQALVACRDRVEFRLHGACVGAGAELAAFGRRVVAAPDTWFQLPELGFGLIPGAGGCVSLVHRIGRQRTAWLVLSGRRIDVATALEWGLVDSVS